MIVIRLARGGKKRRPFYFIIVTDKRSPRDGKFIERLGFYNPSPRGNDIPLRIALERVDYWIRCGAQLTPKVASLFKQAKTQQTVASADAAS